MTERCTAHLLYTCLFLVATPILAQHPYLLDHDWDPLPQRPDTTLLGDANSLLMARNIVGHFQEDENDIRYFEVFHLQRYLHDEAAVDANKTIELGTGSMVDLLRVKARSIAPDGRITELAPEAFLTSAEAGDMGPGLYFAFEGLVPGSIIEYYTIQQQTPDLRGTLVRLQFGIPALEQRFELLVPDDWQYVFKGYNGVPVPEVDSTMEGVLRHHLQLLNTPALEDESHAEVMPYRMYLVHKLDAIPARNARNISSYANATRNFHGAIHPELGTRTRKELASRLKRMGQGFARDEEDRIRSIDLWIRSNFRVTDMSGPELADLDIILRTGNCSSFGLQRLYCAFFREAGIEYELVVTNNATLAPFDPEFESYNYLQDVCFHFPQVKKFLDPTELGLGLGYLAPENMGTHGLFIRNREVGGVFTGIGSVKPIPYLPAEATRHDMEVHVHLTDDGTEAEIVFENGLSGYYARYIQNLHAYMNEEQRKDILESHLDHFVSGSNTQELSVDHAEPRWFGVKPFTMKGKVTTAKFNNRAGEDVLLRVGDMIGPQMEMYVDKDRKLPVHSPFTRYYDRKLVIHLPEGWTCRDTDPMTIHEVMEFGGRLEGEFRSTASVEGAIITVHVIEYYNTPHVPLEHFEAYRRVINAAADFNKRSLLLSRVQ